MVGRNKGDDFLRMRVNGRFCHSHGDVSANFCFSSLSFFPFFIFNVFPRDVIDKVMGKRGLSEMNE